MAKAKRNNKHSKKVRNLVAICFLCAVVLSVSTYAWFIGMKTVNVSSFDVEIATTEGLFLSMNGKDWAYKLDARNTEAYAENTNTWAETGLIPMSSVGDMDDTSSTMKLYEKGSLTTTKGGYRLLTSRVGNYATPNADGFYEEGKGYVAFDLFIKNLSGTEYYVDNEPLNEEAIYLTTNSAVTVASDGVKNTGIENSVRVAFTQIGRVKADTDKVAGTGVSNITKITCADKVASTGQVQVTGICRDAQIWEPNDKAHEANAISWYTTSCRSRKSGGTDVTLDASYDLTKATPCGAVSNGTAYKTYAISRAINVVDNVDVYDGAQYNTYTANTKEYATYINEGKTGKLVDFPYFTDTMKLETGMNRDTFMTLAPNSITKVRVYIYIEGQDIDNYDFASLGKKISVKFGFTKERFEQTDIPGYNGPDTNITPTIGDFITAGA